MDFTAYHLQARSAFHFGLRGVGIEATGAHAPSDTLFSALCHALRQQFGVDTLQEFLQGFQAGQPPVLVSSAFPYVLARSPTEVDWSLPEQFAPSQAVRFFPRPLDWPPGVPDLPESRKDVKRVRWVSEGLFRSWVDGVNLSPHWGKDNLLQGASVWATAPERQRVAGWRDEYSDELRLWKVDDVPRVTVDRQRSTSAVYQAGLLRFQPGGGLWFLARWRDDWQERGETALLVLGDSGMGGERSSGYGQFDLHGPHALDALPQPQPGQRFVTLSLYFPSEAELPHVLQGANAQYRLQVRRGWMSSPHEVEDESLGTVRGTALRRKAVRMFAEGSLLSWPGDSAVLGTLADVTPDAFDPGRGGHKVWRYGCALPVGYQGGE